MQLYALDQDVPIVATQAQKEKVYLCPECKNPLKVRGGPSRQIHFYHQRSSPHCRQNGKSEEHIDLQLKLVALIGEEAQIESRFSTISRIADVAWAPQKIIFEIQCSPISLEEVQARNNDYHSIGYRVIWILQDKRFNQNTLCAAESYLRQTGSYFTNRSGLIYDQFEIIQNHKRKLKGPKLPINPLKVSTIPNIATPDIALPKQALKRLSHWKYYTEGDLLHRLIQEKTLEKTAKQLAYIEKKWCAEQKDSPSKRLPFIVLIIKAYKELIQLLLKHQ